MKKYKYQFSFAVIEGHGDAYDPNKPVSISVTENVPEGVSPVNRMAARIAKELRIASNVELEYEAEDADPIASISPTPPEDVF